MTTKINKEDFYFVYYWKCKKCGTYRFDKERPTKCRYQSCFSNEFSKEAY